MQSINEQYDSCRKCLPNILKPDKDVATLYFIFDGWAGIVGTSWDFKTRIDLTVSASTLKCNLNPIQYLKLGKWICSVNDVWAWFRSLF